MSRYKRLTNNNRDEYDPEYDFCCDCKYFGEPCGCNKPNGTCDNYDRFLETYNRLAELENKIENGTLRELPCKVGDIIYYANPYYDLLKIRKFKVVCISITAIYIRIICCNAENEHDISNYYFSSDEINFTEAEAEAKWRKLLKENPRK